MHLQSKQEVLTSDDGVFNFAFDLSGSEAGYLVISLPASDASGDDFFGANHYVEIKDQKFGAYGGLERLTLLSDRSVEIRLIKSVELLGASSQYTQPHRSRQNGSNHFVGLNDHKSGFHL